jgi:hypothetical protein
VRHLSFPFNRLPDLYSYCSKRPEAPPRPAPPRARAPAARPKRAAPAASPPDTGEARTAADRRRWRRFCPQMWKAVYETTKRTAKTPVGIEEALALAWIDHFHGCLDEQNPDLIVSVHPLCQDPIARVLHRIASWRRGRRIPFCTVVTGLDPDHPS